MKTTADVVIIGGGVIGTSILFNLGRMGVTDTLLLERDVLGSGSTGRSQAICRMHYSNPVTATMVWTKPDSPPTISWKWVKTFKLCQAIVAVTGLE